MDVLPDIDVVRIRLRLIRLLAIDEKCEKVIGGNVKRSRLGKGFELKNAPQEYGLIILGRVRPDPLRRRRRNSGRFCRRGKGKTISGIQGWRSVRRLRLACCVQRQDTKKKEGQRASPEIVWYTHGAIVP